MSTYDELLAAEFKDWRSALAEIDRLRRILFVPRFDSWWHNQVNCVNKRYRPVEEHKHAYRIGWYAGWNAAVAEAAKTAETLYRQDCMIEAHRHALRAANEVAAEIRKLAE